MDETAVREHQRGSGRKGLRVVMSLAAVVGLGYLLLISVALAAIKCGDGCDGAIVGPEHWQWTAQLVLATAGVVSGAVALALGFTSKTVAYRGLSVVSLVCVLAWLAWVVGFGAF